MNAVPLLVVLLAAVAAAPGILAAHGDGMSVLSPRAQMSGGIAAEDVACREGLQLMVRGNGDAICVHEQSVQRLADAGIAAEAGSQDGGATYGLMRDAVLAVSNALALYDAHGSGAFEIITAMNVEENAYPFVITSDTAVEMADGSTLDRRGAKAWSDIQLEAAVGGLRDALDRGDGAWMTYVFLNPATGGDQAKMSWVVQRDGYIFGSGFYLEGQRAMAVGSDWSIRNAIAAYDLLGTDGAFAAITSMESKKESYPFVLDTDGTIVAHGANPALVGNATLIAELLEWDDVLDDLAETGRSTAGYEFANPATGTVEPKQSTFVLHDGYVFGSGSYSHGTWQAGAGPAGAPALTDAEAAWLDDNGAIRVAYDPAWQPIEYLNDAGDVDGLTAWYMARVGQYTGADLVGAEGFSTWAGALDAARNGGADVLMMIADTEGRHEFLDFTRPHTTLTADMVTLGERDIDNGDLSGFRIATVGGDALESWLDQAHPGAEYDSFDDVQGALRAVAAGDADMTILPWANASYITYTSGIGGLANSGPSGYAYDLAIGVRNDIPVLKQIMQKALDSIPDEEKAAALEGLYDPSALTYGEEAWLARNGTIRVAYDPGWVPIEYLNDEGSLDGLTGWYVARVERYTGADLVGAEGFSTWAGALDAARNGGADVLMMIADTEGRHEFLDFTRPHTTLTADMVTLGERDIDNGDLSGFRIATVGGDALESWLDQAHPGAEYDSFDDVQGALRAVAAGDADMTILPWANASYITYTSGIGGLANSGPSGYAYDLAIGVRNDIPVLKQIMQKALDSIPDEEKAAALEGLYDPSALTYGEEAWLARNGTIRVAYDPGWVPIEYLNDEGSLDGLTGWYVARVERYTGANLVEAGGISSWPGALDAVRNGDADVLMTVADTEDRRGFMDFTGPHTVISADMVTLGERDIDNGDLSGFRIATEIDDATESWIARTHPGAGHATFDDIRDALRAVAAGDADMVIMPWPNASHIIGTLGIEGLANSGPSGYTYDLAIGVRNDIPMLKQIMQKALDSIPDEEKAAALERVYGARGG